MLRNLERAAEHEDMTEDLAEVLSITNVTVIRSSLVAARNDRWSENRDSLKHQGCINNTYE
jgi:hypothetical protein